MDSECGAGCGIRNFDPMQNAEEECGMRNFDLMQNAEEECGVREKRRDLSLDAGWGKGAASL